MDQTQLINSLIEQEKRLEIATERREGYQPGLHHIEIVSAQTCPKDGETTENKIWEFEEMRRRDLRIEPYVNYLAAPQPSKIRRRPPFTHFIKNLINLPVVVFRILDQNLHWR